MLVSVLACVLLLWTPALGLSSFASTIFEASQATARPSILHIPSAATNSKILEDLSPNYVQRRLLQTHVPASTTPHYCAPNGVCNLSALREGISGFVLQGEAVVDNSGYSVSNAGDVNGDKIDDILIGAIGAAPHDFPKAGKTYVIFGSSNASAWSMGTLNLTNLIDGKRGFVLQGEAANDQSGWSVSSAGDVNGDGLSDILIGARGASPIGFIRAGKTYVIFGSSNASAWDMGTLNLTSLMDGKRGFALQGEYSNDQSGWSVSNAGDVNGDGLSDIIGTYASGSVGKTYIIFGSSNASAWGMGTLNLTNLIDGTRGFLLQGEINDKSGYSVSNVGDVNGDKIDDMLIGAPAAGKTYVIFGSSNASAWSMGTLNLTNLIDGERGFVLQGAANDQSGSQVSSAGDVNGDGLSDILIGARGAVANAFPNAGKTYVIFGSSNASAWDMGTLNLTSLMDGKRGFVLQGEAANDVSGYSVSNAGDVNEDGISDILVGARNALSSAGKTYVIFGSSNASAWAMGTLNLTNLIDGKGGFVLQGENSNDQSGWSVSNVGDVNGDGISDILVGAPYSSEEHVNVVSLNNNANMLDTYLTVANISHGMFASLLDPGVAVVSFYLQNISDGDIQFVSNGDGMEPQCRLVAHHPDVSNLLTIYSDLIATPQTQSPTSAAPSSSVVASKASSRVGVHSLVGGLVCFLVCSF